MSLLSKRAFYRQFPGPFAYTEGVDGVDNTFDVFCVTSNRYLFSTYYWDERARAELIARCVCTALNAPLMGHPSEGLWDDILEFYRLYASPYGSRRTFCEYRGPGYEVFSRLDHHCMIFLPGLTRQNRLITRQIALALTALGRSAPEIPASEAQPTTLPVQCLPNGIA